MALGIPDPPRSQTSHVYRQVRLDILAGVYPPGERLKVADLAEQFEVSPGAVREALSRLVPEQLVISRDQRGFQVAPLSVDDLMDLTDLRCDLEALALRRSVEHATVEWEADILANAHRLSNTPRLDRARGAGLNPDWIRNHSAFHAALISACGNKRLKELHGQLYDQAERYRGMSVTGEARGAVVGRDVPAEHDSMVEAALAKDADKLVAVVVEHIRLTTKLIVGQIDPTAVVNEEATAAQPLTGGARSSRRSRSS